MHDYCAEDRELPISHAALVELFISRGLADKVEDRQFEVGLGHLLLMMVNSTLNAHHSGASIG